MIKDLDWIGSSKKDLIEFPMSVKKEMGHALYMAQKGEMHGDAKPLRGFDGAKVLEIVINDSSGTFRTMYTVQFKEVVYVLHAFQKKSKTGIATPKPEMDLVIQRLKWAQMKYIEKFNSPKVRKL